MQPLNSFNPGHAGPEPFGSSKHQVLFIVNPAAGANRAQQRWLCFKSRLQESGIHFDEALTRGPGHAAELARRATTEYDVLAAVGGDGTVAEIAGAIVTTPGSRATLMVVPFGTGNDLAQVLEIRSEADILSVLTRGLTTWVDLIEITCRQNQKNVVQYASLFAGAGIIAESLKKTTATCKRIFGQRLAYPVGLLRALLACPSTHLSVAFDQEVLDQDFLFVGACNTEIAGGGMRIAPGASIGDGVLNLNLIGAMSRWAALWQLLRLYRGKHTLHPNARYVAARTLRIDAPEPIEIAADGDLIGHTPARIAIKPNCLRVLTPKMKAR